MNEERGSRPGPPRRSGGAGGTFGRGEGARRAGRRGADGRPRPQLPDAGSGGDSAAHADPGAGAGSAGAPVPSAQPYVPSAHGGGRRAGGAQPLDPTDLTAALQRSVAGIGVSGPPRAGMARIRRKAKARQRRRTVLAGSAGVLFLVMAVSVATGNSFDIMPVLTGVVGLGDGGDSAATPSRGVLPDDVGQVRTVRPTAGRKGPAIGPGTVAATPSALAATGVGACGPADLTTVASVDTVIGGVSYGHVEAVAQRSCAVAGPPVLQVENATANAASTVVILPHSAADGSRLPQVPTWGAVLVLHAGQGYDFQFAWAPDACPAPTGSASAAAAPAPAGSAGSAGSGSAGGGSGTSGAASGTPTGAGSATASTYQLGYLVTATSQTSPVTLNAACGATVYVTDVYPRGAFPLPRSGSTASPQPPTSSAMLPPPASTKPTGSGPAQPPQSAGASGGAGASPGTPAASPGVTAAGNAGSGSDGSTGQAGST